MVFNAARCAHWSCRQILRVGWNVQECDDWLVLDLTGPVPHRLSLCLSRRWLAAETDSCAPQTLLVSPYETEAVAHAGCDAC